MSRKPNRSKKYCGKKLFNKVIKEQNNLDIYDNKN